MIPLTIRNATYTWQIERQVDETVTVNALIEALCAELNLPLPDDSSQLGDLVTAVGNTATLYHPRHGILDGEEALANFESLVDDPLILHVDYELADLFSTIELDEERPFDGMLRMVTVNWHDEHYPILLPALATPQGNIEGSLMSTLVIEQLNLIRDVYIDPATIPHGQFYNNRTQQLIQPLDRVLAIGDQVRHGDMLEYRTDYAMPVSQPGSDLDIVILDNTPTVHEPITQPENSLLDEISISPFADEQPVATQIAEVDATEFDVAEFDATDIDLIEPDATELEDVEPDVTESEITEPEALSEETADVTEATQAIDDDELEGDELDDDELDDDELDDDELDDDELDKVVDKERES